MKTKEELSALREEVETMKKKLAELSAEELDQVAGGADVKFRFCGNPRCGRFGTPVFNTADGAKCAECGEPLNSEKDGMPSILR